MAVAERMTREQALELARAWAKKGVPAGPIVISWDERKQATNKRPLTRHGYEDFTTDLNRLDALFGSPMMTLRDSEVYGVGLWPGPGGRVVLDVDTKGGKQGDKQLAALEAEHGLLPPHPIVDTASGGAHVWLAKPREVHVGNPNLTDDIEVRADGGFVVAPGTFTPWGSWTVREGTNGKPPAWPDWLAARLNGHKTGTGGGPRGRWQKLDRGNLDPRDLACLEALEKLGGHGAVLGPDGEVRITRPGKQAGASASIGYVDPGVAKIFTDSWPPLRQNDLYSVDELEALARGEEEPVDNSESSPRTGTSDPEEDLANARLLAARFGDRLRHVVPWRKWLVWDGTRWAHDETGEAARCAKAVSDTLPRRPKKVARAQTRPGIDAMLALAATEPGIALAPSQLDADPYLLNVTNGTLDLRTGEVRPHDRNDLLTKVTRAAYHPDAQAPEFMRFLERVQPDQVMRDFLARLFGHGLLGKVVEHVLPVFYGIGANGKTTLVEAVASAWGDYADTIEPGLLIDRGEVHPTGVADLFKLRLAVTHETDEGRRLAEGTVKRLTGGDRVKARRMREDFWSFDPSHSIVMHTNHKPVVRGTDEGIWRRLRFVPFDVVIPEDERDGKLPERLALEADGILAWCVGGFRQWQDRGLADPKAVTDASAAFRGESDLLALFLDERCMQSPHAHVRSAELFEAWVSWCKRENVDAGTQTAFSRNLTERGFDKDHTRGGKVWRGIGLYADETSGGDGL
jgi:putative DNA primase/helicase